MKIALLGNTSRPARRNGLITGYGIASDDLMRSFVLHSSADEVCCLYEPKQYQQDFLEHIAEEARILVPEKRVRMISEYELLFRGMDCLKDASVLHSVKEDAIPLVSIRESLGKPIPITFTMHGLAEQHLILDTFYPLVYLPFKPYDAIICTSEAVKRTIERILERLERLNPELTRAVGPHRIQLEKIALGVNTTYFHPLNRTQLRQRMGLSEDAFVILWFGRFSDCFKADLYPLLHVFSQLLRNNPGIDLKLILAGSQDQGIDYIDMLKKTIQQMGIESAARIILNEEIEQRAELYAISDVFTSPIDNIQETFGLTPIEAMACGVPQVVSDWDGYRDTVRDGETGFLVHTAWCDCMNDVASADYLPANTARRRLLQRHLAVRSTVVDCSDYARKLQMLIENPELRRKMSANSRERAMRYFDLEQTVRQTEKLWETLTETALSSPGTFRQNNLPMIDYCKDFAAYPSEMLNDNTCFRMTETGFNTSCAGLPQHSTFLDRIEEAILPQLILELLGNRKMTISGIVKSLSSYTSDQVKRELMFLYKYDIVCPC